MSSESSCNTATRATSAAARMCSVTAQPMTRRECASTTRGEVEPALPDLPPPLAHPGPGQDRVITWIEGRYNRRRRHSAIGMLSPVQFETAARHLPPWQRDPCPPAGVNPSLDAKAQQGPYNKRDQSLDLLRH